MDNVGGGQVWDPCAHRGRVWEVLDALSGWSFCEIYSSSCPLRMTIYGIYLVKRVPGIQGPPFSLLPQVRRDARWRPGGRSAQAGLGEAGEHRGRRIGVSLPHLGGICSGVCAPSTLP